MLYDFTFADYAVKYLETDDLAILKQISELEECKITEIWNKCIFFVSL